MLKSMTGYGRSEFKIGADVYSIEMKSLNNRFIDMKIRLPERFYSLENLIRSELKKRFLRGSFSVYVNAVQVGEPEVRINLPLARAYLAAAEKIGKELDIDGGVDARFLLKLKDVVGAEREESRDDDWTALKSGLEEASDRLEEWRAEEGAALLADLMERFAEITDLLSKIESISPEVVVKYRENLESEMKRLLEDRVDEAKVLHEAAIFAQRSDIGEEIVRFKSHLDMFRGYLDKTEPVGKRLDFLCQEILREANTIASKANDLRITQTIVEVKGVLEKMREQVQNVE